MTSIRPFLASDFETIIAWWKAANEPGPTPEMMNQSSFVIEEDGKPMAAVTLYLTNTKVFCMIDNFIKAPECKGKELPTALIRFVENFAKASGYQRTLCMGAKEKLVKRYMELGYTPTLAGVTTLIKEL